MARMPSINRTIRIMPASRTDKSAQAWVALCTTVGCAIDSTRRSLVADVIAALMDAHMASNSKASFAAVQHGLRFVNDSASGAGSPCFVEAKGAGVGELYVFGGATKKDGLLAALGAGNVESTRDETKGGLYIVLTKGADVAHVYGVLALHASVRGPVGYLSSMGACTDLDAVAFEASTVVEAKVEGGPATEAKPSKRSLKRAAKQAASA